MLASLSVSNNLGPESKGFIIGGTCPILSWKFGLLRKTRGKTRYWTKWRLSFRKKSALSSIPANNSHPTGHGDS